MMDTQDQCKHPNLPEVPFDKEACKDKSPAWINEHYPRLHQVCPDCKAGIMCYASFEHYIALDA